MKNKGFTLIELMIVVAIIAIIAAIAIPNLLRSRLQSNEAAAIGNLKTIVGAQTAFAAATSVAQSWSRPATIVASACGRCRTTETPTLCRASSMALSSKCL